MNLGNKKSLASKTLKIGKKRIKFVKSRLKEIKDAITKEDIRGLIEDGAIEVKEIRGRRTNIARKNQRGTGKIKKKVNKRKQEYVKITRKLRKYTKEMFNQGKLNKDEVKEIRKRIRNRAFKSAASLKLYIGGLTK